MQVKGIYRICPEMVCLVMLVPGFDVSTALQSLPIGRKWNKLVESHLPRCNVAFENPRGTIGAESSSVSGISVVAMRSATLKQS